MVLKEVEGPDDQGAMYVYLIGGRGRSEPHRTIEVRDVEVLCDFDATGALIGVEILHLPVS